MAYGLKYTHSFKQIKEYTASSDEWKIEIYLEGYVGGVSEVIVSGGSINMSRGGDFLENVQGTKLSFGLENVTEGQYQEFRTAAWGDYKVILIHDPLGTPTNKFVGYNQSEIYTEPYNQPPYTSMLEFTCGLNHLNHVRFDDSGTFYEGQKTIIEVLRLALNKLPDPIDIREFVNIYEDSNLSTTTDSMFNQIYVDPSIYKEVVDEGSSDPEAAFFCNKVIEEILKPFNAHIFQADGLWYIVRPQEYLDATIYWRGFTANVGTESFTVVTSTGNFTTNNRSVTGTDTANPDELILVAPSTEMSIEVPLNRVAVTYNMNSLDVDGNNLVKNGCFLDAYIIPGPLGVANHWTFTGDLPTAYAAFLPFHDPDGNLWNPHRFEPISQSTAQTFNSGLYFEQTKTNVPVSTTDALQFSWISMERGILSILQPQNFTNAIKNAILTFLTMSAAIEYQFEIQVGTYYLSGDSTAGYSWTTTPSQAKATIVGGFPQPPLTALNNYDLYRRKDWNIVLPDLPEDGIRDIRTRIYRPYTNWPTFNATTAIFGMVHVQIQHTCFELLYLPSGEAPVEEVIVYSQIDEDENIEEIEVIHADGENSVTLNSFRKADTTITATWSRRGKADSIPIINLLLNQLRDIRGGFIKVLSASWIAEMDVFNMIVDSTGGSTKYWIRDYDYNIETNEFSGSLVELKDFSATPITVKTGSSLTDLNDEPPTTGAPPISNDPEFMIVQPPSLINGDQNDLNTYI